MTVLEPNELYKNYSQKTTAETEVAVSHADVFGPFTIGFSDEVGRRIGLMPTIYYSPTDSQGFLSTDDSTAEIGVSLQLIQSLYDLRNVMTSLLVLEHAYSKYDDTTDLASLDLSEILGKKVSELPAFKLANSLSKFKLDLLTEPFNFHRLPAIYLLDHLEIVLTLFQSSDDLQTGVALDYFQQREWRLVQHFHPSLFWYSLGDHADYKDENRRSRLLQRREIQAKIGRSQGYLNACWVLESIDGVPIRDLVSFVSAPNESLDLIGQDISDLFPSATFVPAEDLGFDG
ncbi:hypothetical protein [uncultured Roseobacter sp.]|uniref:hypothetical protein n=1 Tax=uncultured Roseobacter sp. TaxID=114847 RepID=UPI0026094233|nr:hypothetical protein [uncultured Roseobacter sp.]